MFASVDTAATARPINFRVILPAAWNRRAAQLGGGGNNGVIPNLTGGEFLQRGLVTYGSDSGHQLPAFGPRRVARIPVLAAPSPTRFAQMRLAPARKRPPRELAAELAAAVRSDMVKYGKVIKEANIKVQ